MSDYTQITDFSVKDGLTTGDPEKLILGADFDGEFAAISTAIATKFDSADIASEAQAEALTLDTVLITPLQLDNVFKDNGGVLSDLQGMGDPGVDSLLMWDESQNAAVPVTIGTGLQSSGTTVLTDDSGIVHDSLSGFVANEHINHTSVDITAGSGLTGGGDISATRTLNVGAGDGITVNADDVAIASSAAGEGLGFASGVFNIDLTELTQLEGNAIAATDEFLIDDAGTAKAIRYQDAGCPVNTTTSNFTATDADTNQFYELTGATDRTFTINTGVGKAGNWFLLAQQDAGSWQVTGTATFKSSIGNYTRAAGSGILVFCDTADEWYIFGDQASA